MQGKDTIQKLVREGLIEQALDELIKISKGSNLEKQITVLSSSFKNMDINYHAGVVTLETKQADDNRIGISILSFYNKLDSEVKKKEKLGKKHQNQEKPVVPIDFFQGTWLTYRHRIDYKDGKLDLTSEKDNIFITVLVCTPREESEFIYDASCIFLSKNFTGTLTVSDKRAFIELDEKEGSKKILISIHIHKTTFKNNEAPLLKGISNTYIVDGEKNYNPEIGVPILLEKQIHGYDVSKDVTEYKPLKDIPNLVIQERLSEDKRFISILPYGKRTSLKPWHWLLLSSVAVLLSLWFSGVFTTNPKFTIYSTLPESINFVNKELDSLKKDLSLVLSSEVEIKPVSTDSFAFFYEKVKSDENAALIGVPYYNKNNIGFITEAFSSTLPCGMTSTEHDSWMELEGDNLFEEFYVKKGEKIFTFSFGNTGVQAGGCFFKEIRDSNDFKDKRMRILGPAQRVLGPDESRISDLPSEQKVIDWSNDNSIIGFEGVNAYIDSCLGIYKAVKKLNRKVYFYPVGWHEPNTTYLLYLNYNRVNKMRRNKDLWKVFSLTIQNYHSKLSRHFDVESNKTLLRWRKMTPEQRGFIIEDSFPKTLIQVFERRTIEKLNSSDLKRDSMYKKIFKSYTKFHFEYTGKQLYQPDK